MYQSIFVSLGTFDHEIWSCDLTFFILLTWRFGIKAFPFFHKFDWSQNMKFRMNEGILVFFMRNYKHSFIAMSSQLAGLWPRLSSLISIYYTNLWRCSSECIMCVVCVRGRYRRAHASDLHLWIRKLTVHVIARLLWFMFSPRFSWILASKFPTKECDTYLHVSPPFLEKTSNMSGSVEKWWKCIITREGKMRDLDPLCFSMWPHQHYFG